MGTIDHDYSNQQDDLERYLRLFEPYIDQMEAFDGREGDYGGRFALLLRQVLRLLVTPSDLNQRMPRLFSEVAYRYLDKESATVKHFSYEDNRYFFLKDLYDWLQVHQRGRVMRGMGNTVPQ